MTDDPTGTDDVRNDHPTGQGDPTAADAPTGEEGVDTRDASPNVEAARYRSRLRDTEAERDQLAGQLEAMRRAEVERVAAAELKNPAGLWAAGVAVGDLLAADGTVDAVKVTAAAVQARHDIGLETPMTRKNVAPKQGLVPEHTGRRSWADVIAGKSDLDGWGA